MTSHSSVLIAQSRYLVGTANTATATALPLNCTLVRASVVTRSARAACVSPSIKMAWPASLVCASRRAARFTVSPMQV